MDIRPAHPEERDLLFEIDDDASRRYAEGGVLITLADDHPFIVEERARWVASLEKGDVFVAELGGAPVGLAALGRVDGEPYLDQLAVRMAAMGKGVGSALVEASGQWARERGSALWLTTYAHLAWNLPFYARRGFERVTETRWGPEMRAVVAAQREALPFPGERAVMRRPLSVP